MSAVYHADQTPQPRRRKQFPSTKPGCKYCPDCEQEKTLENFSIYRSKPFTYCRDCARKRDAARRQSYKRERKYSPRKPIALIYTREGYKTCPACERELPLEEFPVRKGKHIGSCKECTRAADRERNHLRRPRKTAPKPKVAREGYKVCNTCFDEKPYEDFSRDNAQKDGYRGRCKQCYKRGDLTIPLSTVREEPKIPSLVTKQCSDCGEIKPLPEFAYSPSSPEKRSSDCKVCRKTKKVCPGCNVEKRLMTDFHKQSGNRFSRYCTQCSIEHEAKQQQKNRDRSKESAQRRKSDPKYIEYHREKERMRYNTIPSVAEKARENRRAYMKAHPLKKREFNSRREANKKGNKVGRVSYKAILERDGYWCYICQKDIDPSIKKGYGKLVFDHVIPLVPRPGEPQGTHSEDNIRPSHHICNSRKKNKPLHLLTPYDRQGVE